MSVFGYPRRWKPLFNSAQYYEYIHTETGEAVGFIVHVYALKRVEIKVEYYPRYILLKSYVYVSSKESQSIRKYCIGWLLRFRMDPVINV